jgi:lipopolysaccharide transport system ATP-binding protein
MGLNNRVVLKCENVCLDIPVVSKTELTFKKKFIRSITGGKVSSQKGITTIKALSNLNLTIYSGQRIALIGHNGSGKSSFIRLISGIYTPTSGIFKSSTNIYPLLHKSFLVSPSLTGIDAAKAHYLLIKNNFKNLTYFLKMLKIFQV